MSESKDYLKMAFQSISCFADDGKLDVGELNKIVNIALRDGVVDDNEKRVLRSIISKLTPEELTPEMQKRIEEIRSMYGF